MSRGSLWVWRPCPSPVEVVPQVGPAVGREDPLTKATVRGQGRHQGRVLVLHALKCGQKVNGGPFKRGWLGRCPGKAEVRPVDPVEGVVCGRQARHRGRGGEAWPEANGFYVRHAGREQDTAVAGGSQPQQVDLIEVRLACAVPAAAERYAAEEAHVVF